MAIETYDISCARCGYKTSGLEVTDIEENAQQVSVLAVCRRCRKVVSTPAPPRKTRLAEFRDQVGKAIERMELMHRKFMEKNERRREELQPRVNAGEATLEERSRYARALEAEVVSKGPEVQSLRRTLAQIENALEHASDEPVYHTCGEALELPREDTSGYAIDCPECGERLIVRLLKRQ